MEPKQVSQPVSIFASLMKVDEQNRIVYGRACQEVPDPSGEIFDYATSKPLFEKWSQETSEATAGKSLGNLRSMHAPIAAGKLNSISFQDDECAIDIAAKVVDDGEWAKVMEGVYTGFSIGGSYVKRWKDDANLQRYTAAPIEISLVDKPMIPTAMFFDVVKADGSTMQKAFKHTAPNPEGLGAGTPQADSSTSGSPAPSGSLPQASVTKSSAPPDAATEAAQVEVTGTDAEVLELGVVMNARKLSMAKVLDIVKQGTAEKKFADTANKKYPLDNDAQILAAWHFANETKAAETYDAPALEALKANILAAWTEKHPDATDALKALVPTDAATAMTKSFFTSGWLASIIDSLASLADEVWWQAEYYGDNAAAAQSVKDLLAAAAAALVSMIGSEIETQAAIEAAEGMERSLKAGVEKITSTFGAASDAFQKLHDIALARGAVAAPPSAPSEEPPSESVQKVLADLTKVQERLSAAEALLAKFGNMPQTPRVVLKVASPALAAPVTPTTPVVDKNSDTVVPVIVNGKPDEAATLIKAAHRSGGKPFLPGN